MCMIYQLTENNVLHFVLFTYYGLIISCANSYSFFSFFALGMNKSARPISSETKHRTIYSSFSSELHSPLNICRFFSSALLGLGSLRYTLSVFLLDDASSKNHCICDVFFSSFLSHTLSCQNGNCANSSF